MRSVSRAAAAALVGFTVLVPVPAGATPAQPDTCTENAQEGVEECTSETTGQNYHENYWYTNGPDGNAVPAFPAMTDCKAAHGTDFNCGHHTWNQYVWFGSHETFHGLHVLEPYTRPILCPRPGESLVWTVTSTVVNGQYTTVTSTSQCGDTNVETTCAPRWVEVSRERVGDVYEITEEDGCGNSETRAEPVDCENTDADDEWTEIDRVRVGDTWHITEQNGCGERRPRTEPVPCDDTALALQWTEIGRVTSGSTITITEQNPCGRQRTRTEPVDCDNTDAADEWTEVQRTASGSTITITEENGCGEQRTRTEPVVQDQDDPPTDDPPTDDPPDCDDDETLEFYSGPGGSGWHCVAPPDSTNPPQTPCGPNRVLVWVSPRPGVGWWACQYVPPPPPPRCWDGTLQTAVGCPVRPPAVAVPTVSVTCGLTTFSASWTGWHHGEPRRVGEYQAEWRIAGSSDPWTSLATNVLSAAGIASGAAQRGEQIEVRVQGRGKQHDAKAGSNPTTQEWSEWGPWSAWGTGTSPTCPDPMPVIENLELCRWGDVVTATWTVRIPTGSAALARIDVDWYEWDTAAFVSLEAGAADRTVDLDALETSNTTVWLTPVTSQGGTNRYGRGTQATADSNTDDCEQPCSQLHDEQAANDAMQWNPVVPTQKPQSPRDPWEETSSPPPPTERRVILGGFMRPKPANGSDTITDPVSRCIWRYAGGKISFDAGTEQSLPLTDSDPAVKMIDDLGSLDSSRTVSWRMETWWRAEGPGFADGECDGTKGGPDDPVCAEAVETGTALYFDFDSFTRRLL